MVNKGKMSLDYQHEKDKEDWSPENLSASLTMGSSIPFILSNCNKSAT